MTLSDPLKVVREAINAVPAVKYALGVAGIAAALALAAAFFSSTRAALIGILAMLLLMILLVIFAVLTKLAKKELRLAALVLMWTVLLLFVGSTILTFTSVFFNTPKTFPMLVQEVFGASAVTPNTLTDSSGISLQIASRRSGIVKTIKISPRATVDHLTALAAREFGLAEELPVGSTSMFQIRWVVVHDKAMDYWNRLAREQQRHTYALFLSHNGVRTADDGSDILETLGVEEGMTVNLVAIEDESRRVPPMSGGRAGREPIPDANPIKTEVPLAITGVRSEDEVVPDTSSPLELEGYWPTYSLSSVIPAASWVEAGGVDGFGGSAQSIDIQGQLLPGLLMFGLQNRGGSNGESFTIRSIALQTTTSFSAVPLDAADSVVIVWEHEPSCCGSIPPIFWSGDTPVGSTSSSCCADGVGRGSRGVPQEPSARRGSRLRHWRRC